MSLSLDWPLMRNNITQHDRLAASSFLLESDHLTNGAQVRAFEEEFAAWLGCKYAVMVNSGSSANIITMQVIADRGPGEVIVPVIGWVSDVAAILHAGLTPIFCDVDPRTFGMTNFASLVSSDTAAIFPTHCLGFDAFGLSYPANQFDAIKFQGPPIIEDCCEAIGAVRAGKKLGTWGLASNFSFYYAHHMSTIEGGMICTDDFDFYQACRRWRSHGLVREMDNSEEKVRFALDHRDLDANFIFAEPGFNMRSTEINALIGREQLKRLDANVEQRTKNLRLFLDALDGARYRTDYPVEGSSNYALPLVLLEPDITLMADVLHCLRNSGVEYRRGTAGGGNQMRQPYAKKLWGNDYHLQFPNAEHIHQFGLYIGNYPDLESWKIEALAERLNSL